MEVLCGMKDEEEMCAQLGIWKLKFLIPKLKETGLEILPDPLMIRWPHLGGTVSGRYFFMTLPPPPKRGEPLLWLILSVAGASEEELKTIISGFNRFVGYRPFCRYIHINLNYVTLSKKWGRTITYEWSRDAKDVEERFKELEKDPWVTELQHL